MDCVRPPTKEEFADKRIKCPCCGYLTIVDKEDKNLIQDVCPVCFWQYNIEAINNPDKIIEPNVVSLNEATPDRFQAWGSPISGGGPKFSLVLRRAVFVLSQTP